jgi:molybdopterin-guanine dinucleotide biosynthesis protein A
VSPDGGREQKALSLLRSVLVRKRDDLYHPLSVMRLFAEIVDKWQAVISPQESKSLRKCIKDAIVIVSAFPREQRGRFKNITTIHDRLVEAARTLET